MVVISRAMTTTNPGASSNSEGVAAQSLGDSIPPYHHPAQTWSSSVPSQLLPPASPVLQTQSPALSAANGPPPTATQPFPFSPPSEHTTEAEDAFSQVFDTIEAAQHDDGWSDSGYSESSAGSASTSLSSSVRDFEFENGRRYHKFRQGHYLLPNDDLEQEREDMKHATILTVCGERLHFAPLNEDQPQQLRILDMGTGTGIWCVDMGDRYPSADVLGVDLSPHQPDWVPPNVRFEVDDLESPWLHPDNHFDLIHARHMAIAFKDWDHVLSSAHRALKPGGWIEFCELDYWPGCDDGTQTPDNQHLLWTNKVTEGLATAGVDLHGAWPLKDRIIRAGYKNVVEKIIKVPIGQWPKNTLLRKVGMYMHAVLYDGLQGRLVIWLSGMGHFSVIQLTLFRHRHGPPHQRSRLVQGTG